MKIVSFVVYVDRQRFFLSDRNEIVFHPRVGEHISFWSEDDDCFHIGIVTKIQHVIGRFSFLVVYIQVEPAIYEKLPINQAEWSKLQPQLISIPE